MLGVAEAGFFPGVIVYLSHWFRYQDRAKAVAMFMAAVPVANIIASPISGLILGVNWLGLAGWRWVFILEGIPAVILGIATLFYLTDRPKDAKWLAPEQRDWISGELEKEKEARRNTRSQSLWRTVANPKVILLTLVYFFAVTSAYGFNFWLPTIVKGFGFSNFETSLISSLPYVAGLVMMLVDRLVIRPHPRTPLAYGASAGRGLHRASFRSVGDEQLGPGDRDVLCRLCRPLQLSARVLGDTGNISSPRPRRPSRSDSSTQSAISAGSSAHTSSAISTNEPARSISGSSTSHSPPSSPRSSSCSYGTRLRPRQPAKMALPNDGLLMLSRVWNRILAGQICQKAREQRDKHKKAALAAA